MDYKKYSTFGTLFRINLPPNIFFGICTKAICSAHKSEQCRLCSAHGVEPCRLCFARRHSFMDQIMAKITISYNFEKELFQNTLFWGVLMTFATIILRESSFNQQTIRLNQLSVSNKSSNCLVKINYLPVWDD